MDEYLIDGSTLLDIANAIRVKKGTTAKIDPADFASEILSIIGSGVDMQTLTIINSNNTSETATFTMPSRYTFSQFVGSEYDTSGGAIVIEYGSDVIKYNGIYLYLSDMESHVFDDTVARGTLYYEGAESDGGDSGGEEQTYTLSGTWAFKEGLVDSAKGNGTYEVAFTSSRISYTSITWEALNVGYAIRYDDTEVANASYSTGTTFTTNKRLRVVTFDSEQTVSKEFYEWFTQNADKQSHEISGSWSFNETVSMPQTPIIIEANFKFGTSSNVNIYYMLIEPNRIFYVESGSTTGLSGRQAYTADTNSWGGVESACRHIKFDGVQKVTEEFYEWFTSNAKETISEK